MRDPFPILFFVALTILMLVTHIIAHAEKKPALQPIHCYPLYTDCDRDIRDVI